MNCDTKNGCAPAPECAAAVNEANTTMPACDVWEAEDGVHVVAEMPGVEPGSVEVTIEGDVLSLRGEAELSRVSARAEGRPATIAIAYQRAFQLKDTADADAIQASCKDGLVHLLVPRKQPARRKIAVSVS